MANIAQTVNVLQAVLLADAETGALVRTPTFHVFEMNKVHHDAVAVPVHVRAPGAVRAVEDGDVPTASAAASVRYGVCNVSVTNADLAELLEVLLDVRGSRVGEVRGRVLAPLSARAFNTAERPAEVAPRPVDELAVTPGPVRLTVPPHAFAVV